MKRFMLVSLMSCMLVGQSNCSLLSWVTTNWNGLNEYGKGLVAGAGASATLCAVVHGARKLSWINNVIGALGSPNMADAVKAVAAKQPTLANLDKKWTYGVLGAAGVAALIMTPYCFGKQHENLKLNPSDAGAQNDARGWDAAKFWGSCAAGAGAIAVAKYMFS